MQDNKIATVTIDENGDVIFLACPANDIFLETATVTQRASHVEPDEFLTRVFFHLLRSLFGDKGRVSDWTRLWNVGWRVNTKPVGGPILRWKHLGAAAAFDAVGMGFDLDGIAVWTDREAAIREEVTFLNEFFLTGTKTFE